MEISVRKTLQIRDETIRQTIIYVEYCECNLCYRHIQKGQPVIAAMEENGKRVLWLCPEHIKKDE